MGAVRTEPGRSFGALSVLVLLLYWTTLFRLYSGPHGEDSLHRPAGEVVVPPSKQFGGLKSDDRVGSSGVAERRSNPPSPARVVTARPEKQRRRAPEEVKPVVTKKVPVEATKSPTEEKRQPLRPASELPPVTKETQQSGASINIESAEDDDTEEGEDAWAGERLTVTDSTEDISDEALAEMTHHSPQEERKYFPDTRKPGAKYFLYQPSGGWGNQRLIIRWAMIVANAMNRTLAISPLAPHSDIWSGYNKWQKHELLPADRVLDVKALNEAIDQGVVFLDDIPARVVEKAVNRSGMTAKVHVKGHYVNFYAKVKKLLIYKESEIREAWKDVEEDIVFWDKMSMWLCCSPNVGMDSIWYGKHIMFNSMFKSLARGLMADLGPYNAVHVRRGDMTISKDRRTAEVYYRSHHLDRFDKSLPLYIATNEKNVSWFDALTLPGRFTKIVFWRDLKQDLIKQTLDTFPVSMKGDISGFIDMLICGNAVKWEGSRKSTFSAAISAIRMSPQLRALTWSFPERPSLRKRAVSDRGDENDNNSSDDDDEDVQEEAEKLLLGQNVEDRR